MSTETTRIYFIYLGTQDNLTPCTKCNQDMLFGLSVASSNDWYKQMNSLNML